VRESWQKKIRKWEKESKNSGAALLSRVKKKKKKKMVKERNENFYNFLLIW
jgi:hypothetical protein